LTPPRRPEDEWLRRPEDEIDETIPRDEALREAARCFSCGLCLGCRQCWMYCNAGGFRLVPATEPGNYFALDTTACEGCGKCIEVGPSGFLSIRQEPNP
jgi:Pyruvate/2-oxoacid:ferredoxin oxidoreductase delta subunit